LGSKLDAPEGPAASTDNRVLVASGVQAETRWFFFIARNSATGKPPW